MKKIWIYSSKIPPDFSGSGIRSIKHAKWFVKAGYDVLIVTATETPEPVQDVRIISLNTTGKGGFFNRYINLVKIYFGLSKAIKQHGKPDILHLFGGGIITFALSLICQKYRIFSISEVTVTLPDYTWKRRFNPHHYIRKFGLNRFDQIIAISEGVKKSLSEIGLHSKIKVIHNGVDMLRFYPVSKEKKAEIREKMGLSPEKTLVLMVGRVGLRKGHDIGIEVILKLRNDLNCKLIAVGPCNDEDVHSFDRYLSEGWVELYKEKHIQFTGKKNNIEEYFQACDVFLFPSRKEGFGNVLIEAMASKIPVVASYLPGITDDIIDHGRDGFLVKDENIEAYIKAIKTALQNKEIITEQALSAIKKKFSEEVIYKQYEELYSQTINY